MSEFVINIFTAIVIAAVSSWITIRLSLNRFRTEKWWERRVDAYSKVIEALHNSKAFSHQNLEAVYVGKGLPDERDKELSHRAKIAEDDIMKAIDVGAFLLSDEALSCLKQYQQEVARASQYKSWYEYLEADLQATEKCLNNLIQIAKRDLKAK